MNLGRSIRFRLTAWYAALLLLLILLLGAGLFLRLESELRHDIDDRLLATAEEMKGQFEVGFTREGPVVVVPPPGSFTFPSQLVEVVDADGQAQFQSENLGDRQLPGDGHHGDGERPDGEGSGAAGIPSDPTWQTVEVDGVKVRMLVYPLELQGETIGAIKVGQPLIQLDQTLHRVRRGMIVAALLGVLLAAIGGWFIAGRALRPVKRVTDAAGAIAASTGVTLPLSERIAVPPTGDEIAGLATTFNRMLDRVEQAFTAQRRFVADASHELRTPLAAMRGNLDLMERQARDLIATDPEVAQTVADLERENDRMSRLVADLLALAQADAPGGLSLRRELMALPDSIDEAVRTVTSSHPGVVIDRIIGPACPVLADPHRIAQVLVILLDNAARYSPDDVTVGLAGQGEWVTVSVTDRGPGIAPEDLARVFEPFWRSDRARDRAAGGAGLGLAIARAIAHAHGGELSATSVPGEGATFTLALPCATGIASIPA